METQITHDVHGEGSAESSQTKDISAQLRETISNATSISELQSLAVKLVDRSNPKDLELDRLISGRTRELTLNSFSPEIRHQILWFIEMIEESTSPTDIREITDDCREWAVSLKNLGDNAEIKQNTLVIVIEIAASRRIANLLLNSNRGHRPEQAVPSHLPTAETNMRFESKSDSHSG